MAFSIDGVLSHAWRFEDVTPNVVAQTLRCSVDEAKRELANLHAELADPRRAAALFDALPVPALAVLALLGEHGGMLPDDELVALARTQYGMARDEVAAGLGALLGRVLVVTLATTYGGRCVALIEPVAEAVLERLIDLDVPLLERQDVVTRSDHDGGRGLLAACAMLDHVEVKLTQSGLPHRAAIKRLAKQLGATEGELEAPIATAYRCGLLACGDDQVLRPDHARLRAAACGRYIHDPALAALAARLAEEPLPGEAVTRWLRRIPVGRGQGLAIDDIARLPGFRLGASGAVPALALDQFAGMAAATVTPSFEVFLPPESRLVDIVEVLACAELVRIDRVIVARITKSSIVRAASAGLDGATVIAALAAACRTPIPQNVETAIRDWSSAVIFATTAVGRVIVVPAADESRVVAALAAWTPRVMAPGVLLIGQSIPPRAVAVALAKIGIHEREPACNEPRRSTAQVSVRDRRDASLTASRFDAPAAAAGSLPPPPAADPKLRARLAAYRRGDETERKLVPKISIVDFGGPASNERLDGASADDVLLEADPEVADRLMRWEHRKGCELSDEDFAATLLVLDAVGDDDQEFLLAASGPAELDRRVKRVLVRGGFSAVLAKHRELIEPLLPAFERVLGPAGAEVIRALNDDGATSRDRSSATPRAEVEPIDWHRDNLLARLQAAARTRSTMVLDLGTRHQTIAVTRVMPRGSVWMVLGDDLDDDLHAVAIPLTAIDGVAEPNTASKPTTWQPSTDQAIPPGHVPCPCGSGRRYRNCCRRSN